MLRMSSRGDMKRLGNTQGWWIIYDVNSELSETVNLIWKIAVNIRCLWTLGGSYIRCMLPLQLRWLPSKTDWKHLTIIRYHYHGCNNLHKFDGDEKYYKTNWSNSDRIPHVGSINPLYARNNDGRAFNAFMWEYKSRSAAPPEVLSIPAKRHLSTFSDIAWLYSGWGSIYHDENQILTNLMKTLQT